MKSDRLFQMVFLLTNNPQLSAPDLAAKLAVSVRTVYRYVDTLSAAGLPIYVTQGRNGGIALMPGYKFSNTLVNDSEQKNILGALNSLKELGVDNGETVEKLAAIFHQKPIEWLTVDPSVWGSDQKQKAVFSTLRQAILHEKAVTFNYRNTKNEYSVRQVLPYQVIFKSRAWYLSGFSFERRAERLFKLVRMDHVALATVQTNRLVKAQSSSQSEVQTAVPKIQVKLRANNNIRYQVDEYFPELAVTETAQGHFLMTGEISQGEWLIRYILSFGANLEVLAPASLQAQVKQTIHDMLNNY